MIDDFGPKVASVWNDLRSSTRNLLERAWRSATNDSTSQVVGSLQYDPRADNELSRLLVALDARANEGEKSVANESSRRLRKLADACATILANQTQSAEVFSQLIQRAHERKDYARVDELAGLLPQRLAPSEICELARSNNVVVRALAHEALTQMPARLLAALLRDPIDSGVAEIALQRQAGEYLSEEAQRILREYEDSGL
jgi:hypothetical protein